MIVFTDLDATLLDHESYDWRPAVPALERLFELKVPVVICTSKTAAEVEPLWREIGTGAPFIVENGGGVFLPRAFQIRNGQIRNGQIRNGQTEAGDHEFQTLTLGAPYAELRDGLEDFGHPLGARGFGDMTAADVADCTGLALEEARSAKQRRFTEPFLLDDETVLPKLEAAAAERGFKITRGGRFFHLQGQAQDKGRAVQEVTRIIDQISATAHTHDLPRTVGLGDSPNDRGMLEVVDVAVVIPHPERAPLQLERTAGVVHAPAPGPVGWNAAMLSILGD